MKEKYQVVFLLVMMVFIPGYVKAESSCNYSEQAELNKIVADVKATYEPVSTYVGKGLDVDKADEEGNIPEIDVYARVFHISLLNVTDDVYVKVTNNYDDTVLTLRKSDAKEDGIVTFQAVGMDSLITYTFEVYANKYACLGELFRKFYLTTPIYNRLSETLSCKDYPNYYYCQEYLNSEPISYDAFFEGLDKYKESLNNKKAEEKKKNVLEIVQDFYKKNKIAINIVLSIGVIVGGTTIVIVIKKRRSRVL